MLQRVRTIHADSRQTYGVRRVTAMLQREWPCIGRRRVHRLIQSAGVQGRMWRRRSKTTQAGTDAVAASGLVERCFERDRVDEVWITDSTYIQGYLAVVMDYCSKRIVGAQFLSQPRCGVDANCSTPGDQFSSGRGCDPSFRRRQSVHQRVVLGVVRRSWHCAFDEPCRQQL